jgi:hypothetical protein
MAISRRPVSTRRKATRFSRKAKAPARMRKGRSAYDESTLNTRGTNPQNAVTFRGYGFPDRLTTNLVYGESFVLDPSSGTPAPFTVWRTNSLFDPQYALGGGQPAYFDQLKLIYNRYKVNGSKITASFSRGTTAAANVGPYLCGITIGPSPALPSTNPGVLMSSPNTISRLVSIDDGTVNLVQTYSAKNTFPDQMDNLQAQQGANPAQDWLAKVFAIPQGIDIEVPINVVIRIEFNCTFSDVLSVVDA